MKKLLNIFLFCTLLPCISRAQNIVSAEYFFDTDPGYGGTGTHNIDVTPGTTVNITSLAVSVAGLSPGSHWMFVRTKDATGNISLYEPQQFYITNYVTAAEYFLDTDHGIGTGTPITIATPAETVSLTNYTIYPDIPDALTQDYTHSLFVRTKDATGKWSLYEPQNLYECGTSVSITQGSSVTVCAGTPEPIQSVVNTADYNLQFTGANNYVKVPDALSLEPTDFTIESYFNASSFTSDNTSLLGKRYATGNNVYSFLIYLTPSGNLHAYMNPTTHITFSPALILNTWHHVALVKSGTSLSLYLDGVFETSSTCPATPSYDTSGLFIGAQDYNYDGIGDYIFNGKMDEMRIWNYARTQAQISANMNTIINPASDGLVGYWRMDEGSGTTVKDRSVDHNNGTTYNSPTWVANSSPVQHAFTYSWLPATGLNTTNTAAVTAAPATTTVYTVTTTETATGCSATASITAIVLNPVASSSSPVDAPICQGAQLNLYCESVDPATTTFSWIGPNGFSSTLQNPTIENAPHANGGIYGVIVTDVTGCTATASTSVGINYVEISLCPSQPPVNSSIGQCGANVNYQVPIVNGNPQPTITYSQNPGTFFTVGSHPVTVIAINPCDTVTCTFDIVVNDNEPPLFPCPPPVTLNADAGLCSASNSLLIPPIAQDNCGVSTIANDAPLAIPVGTTQVHWTVTDIHGNSSTCTQYVTVVDNQNPTITPPADVNVNVNPGICSANNVVLGAPTIHDNCGVNTPYNNFGPFPSFSVGTTDVLWTVTDIHGNSGTCIQHVTVVDNENPTITPGADAMANADPGMCSASNVFLPPPTTHDNCGVNPPTNDAPIIFNVGTTNVHWTVNDLHGNSASCTQHVIVADNQNPTITCPADVTVNTDPGQIYASNVLLGVPVTNDNCGVNPATNDAPVTFQIGTTDVHWSVTDIHGNSAIISCTQHVTVANASCTEGTLLWQKSLGGSLDDVAYSIQQTSDGGYIVAGSSNSIDGNVLGNHGYHDYWIVKLDIAGVIEWQKSYGGSLNEEANAIEQTIDGGYIIAGHSASNDGDVSGNHGAYDYWVVKLDNSGTMIWQKSLGGSADDYAYSIHQTSDEGYVVAGYSYSSNGNVSGNHGYSDYWIVKLDNGGTVQWQKSLGGSSNEWAQSIQQTYDGGYIVAGYSGSNDEDVSGNHGGYDYWIVKLDNTGTIIWQKSLGGSLDETAYSIQQTFDEGYIVAGYSTSNNGDVSGNHGTIDYWIVKLDNSGTIQWQKSLGSFGLEDPRSIRQTSDGGYIVAGRSSSNGNDVSGNHGNLDYWVVKLDNSGTIQWQKSLGGSSQDVAYSVQQTSDAGYVVAGTSNSNNLNVSGNHGGYDYWIVKLSGIYPTTWYADADGDGYGNGYISTQACSPPTGYVANSTDCNDGNAAIHPGASDICNSIDDNCNGTIDENAITATVTPSGTATVCEGSSIILTANSGTGITYQWIKGTKNIPGETNPTYTTNKAAGYKVKETNSFGCSSTSAVTTVVLSSLPAATITPQGSLDLCVQTPVTLQANGGTGFTYQWKKGSSNPANSTNQTYAATETGSYKVVVTNSSGCSRTSAAVSVVKNKPAATITPLSSLDLCGQASLTLQANAGNGYNYQWIKGTTNLTGATNQTYAAITTGKYKVIVTSSGGCSTTSAAVVVTKSCKESSAGSPPCCTQLDIYPNPNDGHFVIDLQTESDETAAVIDVFNSIGQRIYQQVAQMKEGMVHEEIQLPSTLSAALYFVRMMVNNQVYTGQISYQK